MIGDGSSDKQPTILFTAVGQSVKGDSSEIAYDRWKCTYSEPKFNITKVHYYSEPEISYVEIKEGSPTNETYEAMAGVPTTEDLYLGFGTTEFMVKDCKYRKQPL